MVQWFTGALSCNLEIGTRQWEGYLRATGLVLQSWKIFDLSSERLLHFRTAHFQSFLLLVGFSHR